jgi:hypothetical protein
LKAVWTTIQWLPIARFSGGKKTKSYNATIACRFALARVMRDGSLVFFHDVNAGQQNVKLFVDI